MRLETLHLKNGWIFFICLYLFFLLVLAALSQPVVQNNLTSDTLYSICVYEDWFVNGYGVKGWVLPPAPYFFPDMALLFPLFSLLPDYGYGLIFFNWILWSGILLCLLSIGRRLGASEGWTRLSSLTGMLLFFLFLGSFRLDGLMGYALLPTFHTGSLLWGFVTWALIVRWMQVSPSKYEYFFFLIGTSLMAMSDSLYTVQFLLPAILAVGLCAWLDFAYRRLFLVFPMLSLIAYTLGLCFLVLGNAMGWFSMPIGGGGMLIPLIEAGPVLIKFLQDMRYFLWSNLHFALWLLVITPLCFFRIYSLGLRIKRKTGDRHIEPLFFLFLSVVFSLLLTVAAIVISGRWASFAEIRYLQTGLLFPFVATIWLMQADEKKISTGIEYGLLTLVVGLSLVVHGQNLVRLDLQQWKLPYPDYVRHVDYYAAKYQLKYGLSDYWNAKYISAFSRRGLRVNQVTEDIQPQPWINNGNWYRTVYGEPVHYDFVITERLNEERMIERWGDPQERINCQGRILFIYKEQPVMLEK